MANRGSISLLDGIFQARNYYFSEKQEPIDTQKQGI